MKRLLSLSMLLLLLPAAARAAETVKFDGPAKDLKDVVAMIPTHFAPGAAVSVTDAAGKSYRAQVRLGSLALGTQTGTLDVLIPEWKAGQKLELKADDKGTASSAAFQWTTHEGHPLLTLNGKPVLEYMNDKHDASSPTGHYSTFKLFHHVYDPVEGKTLLSSGAYKSASEAYYPHHRGLFYGFNKITYGDKQADVWHGTKKEFVSDEGILAKDAGSLLGSQRLAIDWHGQDGGVFAKEQRELTAYNIPGGTMIDFVSTLKTDLPLVHLDGDPQHAGFHFRANQEVAKMEVSKDKNGKEVKKNVPNPETYYLRPDGKGKPAETRNWDPKTKKGPVNQPWDAMSFVVGGKRYTALYLDSPKNPKEARGSERDYGRFGTYFEYNLTPDKPLTVRYRMWFQAGEMTVEQCQAMSDAFTFEPKAEWTH